MVCASTVTTCPLLPAETRGSEVNVQNSPTEAALLWPNLAAVDYTAAH